MTINYETSADFIAAVSLFAALEGACLPAGEAAALPYLGMARAELTDYGQRLPTHFEDIRLSSFDDGISRLTDLLDRMLAESPDLRLSLRLHAARELLLEGTRP